MLRFRGRRKAEDVHKRGLYQLSHQGTWHKGTVQGLVGPLLVYVAFGTLSIDNLLYWLVTVKLYMVFLEIFEQCDKTVKKCNLYSVSQCNYLH